MKSIILVPAILALISVVFAKNAENRKVVTQLMEAQGYKFWGFSYDYGWSVYNITSGAGAGQTPGNADAVNNNDTLSTETDVTNTTTSKLQKRSCVGSKNTCGANPFFGGNFLLGGSSAIGFTTNACTESATNDDVLLCIDNGCVWLDNFFCNDFERGETNGFPIPPNFRMRSNSIVILQKFGNQLWQVAPSEIIIATSPGVFREFLFNTRSFRLNCNCGSARLSRGFTLNDDPASCTNIFGGGCPRGYKFRLTDGLLVPFTTIGGI